MAFGFRVREIAAGPLLKFEDERFMARLQERPVEMVAVKDTSVSLKNRFLLRYKRLIGAGEILGRHAD